MFNYIPWTSREPQSWSHIPNSTFGHGDNSSYGAGAVENIFQNHHCIPMRSTCSIIFHRHPSIQNQVVTSHVGGSEYGRPLSRFKSLDTGRPERGGMNMPPPGHFSKTGPPNRMKLDIWSQNDMYIPFTIPPGQNFELENVYYIHQRVYILFLNFMSNKYLFFSLK